MQKANTLMKIYPELKIKSRFLKQEPTLGLQTDTLV